MSITITEALAEIKTIDARIQKKRDALLVYVWRQEGIKDPLSKEGGSVEFIRREIQSIKDLGERKVALRRGINKANVETTITVNGVTKSIADWLTWRRDVCPQWGKTLEEVRNKIKQGRDEAFRRQVSAVSKEAEATKPTDIVINVEEASLAGEIELGATIIGTLDGQLSLKNATTLIEV